MDIKFPVFVRAKDSGEVTRYSSVSEMQHQFEQVDVENDEYEAWDVTGNRLSLTVQRPIWLRIELSGTSARRDELADVIRNYAEVEDAQLDLSELERNEFTAAFDRVQEAISRKRSSRPWLQRLKSRF
jgi:hypothetical protein